MGKYFIMDFYDEVKKGAGTFSIQRRDAQGNIDEYFFSVRHLGTGSLVYGGYVGYNGTSSLDGLDLVAVISANGKIYVLNMVFFRVYLENAPLPEEVSDISEFQPISLSEMPQVYLTSGNGRIAYMLKSYSLKLMDVYRNEVFRQMKTNPKKAIGNFARLTFYITMLGVGADSLKDFLMGREINLGDTFMDNIFKLAMLSKYQVENFRKDGIGKAILSSAIPPTNVFDDLYKDITDKKLYTGEKPITSIKTIRNIPVAGKLYYWWFGAGTEVKEKELKTKIREKYKKAYSNGGERTELQSVADFAHNRGFSEKEIKNLERQGHNAYTKPYEQELKAAFRNKDKTKIQNAMKNMEQKKVNPIDRRRIYNKVLKDYYKNRGFYQG